jgi:hypothetical protein
LFALLRGRFSRIALNVIIGRSLSEGELPLVIAALAHCSSIAKQRRAVATKQ